MKSVAIIIFLTSFFVDLIAQNQIDFENKVIKKEVEKLYGLNLSECSSITIPDLDPSKGKFISIPYNNKKYLYIGRVLSCRAGGCSISRESNGPSEYFDYFVLYNERAEVEYVKVYNYAATHGQEVTAKGWLKQFNGHSSDKQLEVGKNIDGISGATISVYSITADIKEKTTILAAFLRHN